MDKINIHCCRVSLTSGNKPSYVVPQSIESLNTTNSLNSLALKFSRKYHTDLKSRLEATFKMTSCDYKRNKDLFLNMTVAISLYPTYLNAAAISSGGALVKRKQEKLIKYKGVVESEGTESF